MDLILGTAGIIVIWVTRNPMEIINGLVYVGYYRILTVEHKVTKIFR